MELPFAAKIGFCIAFAGILLSLVGGILMMVAAFTESVFWGLCFLFLPFANFAFLFTHWEKAKKGFFVFLLGALVTFGGSKITIKSFEADPAIRKAMVDAGFKVTTSSSSDQHGPPTRKPEENSSNLDEKVRLQSEIGTIQGEISVLQAKVSEEYSRLTQQRKSLKASDPQSVQAFNLQVATYDKDNRELATKNERLANLWKQLDALNQESSRIAKLERASYQEDSQVVLYTTSWCPACKSAKAYLTQRGISYQEKDVERSREAAEEFQRRGGGGVPMVVINGSQMTGFSPEWVQQQLAKR